MRLNVHNVKATFNLQSIMSPEPEDTVAIDTLAVEVNRAKLRRKAGRSCVLIIGRANAGKTTILKKICNTTDEPQIYTRSGRKVIGSYYKFCVLLTCYLCNRLILPSLNLVHRSAASISNDPHSEMVYIDTDAARHS